MTTSLMHTPLYESHCRLGARMVPFCGWEMPIQYKGIIEEHRAVREKVGLFDVSHMGRISVVGEDAERFLDFLATSKLKGKKDGSCAYTTWATEDGEGTVDDLLVYREDATHFFVVINGANREADLAHLKKYQGDFSVTITPEYADEGIIAVQGPESSNLMKALFEDWEALGFFRFKKLNYQGKVLICSRTGYTGELGYECIVSHDVLESLWEKLLELGGEPIGLGARNTLRLEMGYALHGNDLSAKIAPTESVARWAVHLDKESFLGKEALLKKEASRRCAHALIMEERGIPRDGYRVFHEGKEVGFVTSGAHSPSLEKGIALALLDASYEEGTHLDIEIRGKFVAASVAKLPLYQKK